MTDYNDGKWHGWNGGICPVHPKTKVIAITPSGYVMEDRAGELGWDEFDDPDDNIVVFCVIKAHQEPREFWVNVYDNPKYSVANSVAHTSREQADHYAAANRIECIHVREVLEE